MFPGDDECMSRRLGIDIVECDDQIVFVNERCRNGPRDDVTKDAVTHEVGPFLRPDLPNLVASS